MRTHYLKCWPEFFYALRDGSKTFEVRKDDRGFCVGETLVLALYDPVKNEFMSEARYISDAERVMLKTSDNLLIDRPEIKFTITHKLPGGQFGIEPGYCVLGIKPA
jgi:hypothetical protein